LQQDPLGLSVHASESNLAAAGWLFCAAALGRPCGLSGATTVVLAAGKACPYVQQPQVAGCY
jgi:hypothetical protein